MSETTDFDLHLPCFPTPPYEGPDDDWMAGPAGPGLGSACSSPGTESWGKYTVDDDTSEFPCVPFSDVIVDPASDTPLHASDFPLIRDAPTFGTLEVDALLDELKDVDITSVLSNDLKSGGNVESDGCSPDAVCTSLGSVADSCSTVNIPALEVKTSTLPPNDVDDDEHSSGDVGSNSETDTYKGKLRRRSTRKASTNDKASMKRGSSLVDCPKGDEPALKMLKFSHLDQFSKGEAPRKSLRARSENCSIDSLEHEAEVDTDKSRKAAIQAKINREKKKVYVRSLETQRNSLQTENQSLRGKFHKLEKSHKSLEQEVDYLKNVLQNQSMLAGLLKNIGSTHGVSLSSSFVSGKRKLNVDDGNSSSPHDHDYGKSQRQINRGKQGPSPSQTKTMTGGICLHVQDDENVSLEFCSTCAKRAKESFE